MGVPYTMYTMAAPATWIGSSWRLVVNKPNNSVSQCHSSVNGNRRGHRFIGWWRWKRCADNVDKTKPAGRFFYLPLAVAPSWRAGSRCKEASLPSVGPPVELVTGWPRLHRLASCLLSSSFYGFQDCPRITTFPWKISKRSGIRIWLRIICY